MNLLDGNTERRLVPPIEREEDPFAVDRAYEAAVCEGYECDALGAAICDCCSCGARYCEDCQKSHARVVREYNARPICRRCGKKQGALGCETMECRAELNTAKYAIWDRELERK